MSSRSVGSNSNSINDGESDGGFRGRGNYTMLSPSAPATPPAPIMSMPASDSDSNSAPFREAVASPADVATTSSAQGQDGLLVVDGIENHPPSHDEALIMAAHEFEDADKDLEEGIASTGTAGLIVIDDTEASALDHITALHYESGKKETGEGKEIELPEDAEVPMHPSQIGAHLERGIDSNIAQKNEAQSQTIQEMDAPPVMHEGQDRAAPTVNIDTSHPPSREVNEIMNRQPASASMPAMITRPPPPSMLPSPPSLSDELSIPEAQPVEEKPEQPVHEAFEVEDEHWMRRNQKKSMALLVLIITVMAVVLGVSFGVRTDGASLAVTSMPSTSPPTKSSSPSTSIFPTIESSMFPSSLPTSSTSPSTTFSPTTTMTPSFQPSDKPSFSPRRCFIDRKELKAAVDEYALGGPRCSEQNLCNVTQVYGWPIGTWCVSNVTDMRLLFEGKVDFNDDISRWDVSSVTNMRAMFGQARNFNSDLSNWDTSSVEDLSDTFSDAFAFNGDVSKWDTSQVTTMESMFEKASAFDRDVSNWDTSSVEDMSRMFFDASSFDGNLTSWNTAKVTTTEAMFNGASSFNGAISSWDTSSTDDMSYMFLNAALFNQSLCPWGDTFPYNNAINIFSGSGCLFQDDPEVLQKGPFCASSCNVSMATHQKFNL